MKQIEPFSFVHCADLHLDSPFEGFVAKNAGMAAVLQEATFKAFDQVIDVAIENKVAFLLIGGDIYNGANHSLRAQIRFAQAVGRAVQKGIPCYVVHGNHDPLKAWQAHISLPEGVHVFGGDEVTKAIACQNGKEVASIYGISHKNYQIKNNLAKDFRRQEEDHYAIGLLHCNAGASPEHDEYAPCSLADLRQVGMDYWALGHIHLCQELSTEPPVVYPGNPQGLCIKELGPKGCYLVQVNEAGEAQLTFKETDVVRWFQAVIAIDALETIEDLCNAVSAKKATIQRAVGNRAAILRLAITGRGTLHGLLKKLSQEQDLLAIFNEGEEAREKFIWLEAVEINTRPEINVEQRKGLPDLTGDFLRSAADLRVSAQTIRGILAKRPEGSKIADYLQELSDQDLLSIAEEAQMDGLDLLLEGEEA